MNIHTVWERPADAEESAPMNSPDKLTLLEKHDIYFQTSLATSPELVRAAQALRYQVYCLERHFENPDEHRDGLERDIFDSVSIHGILYHRPRGEAIGTVRMIRADEPGITTPIEELLNNNGLKLSDYVDLQTTVEISRFAISKNFRRRSSDEPGVGGDVVNKRQLMRDTNLACLSLIQFLVRQSTSNRINYWTGVMEPRLLRMLASMGIRFTSVGSLVMHHGLRQPCFCEVPKILDEVRSEFPEYWSVLTNGGRLQYLRSKAARKVLA